MIGFLRIIKALIAHRFFYHMGTSRINIALYLVLRLLETLYLPFRTKANKTEDLGESAVKILQNLGPIYIKFGQSLSTRPDIIGENISGQLKNLQDKLPPFPAHIAKKTIENTFDKKINEIFAEFDDKEVAAASIAQVHRAKLISGEKVAVKILRPGIHKEYSDNIQMLYFMAKMAGFLAADSARLRFKDVIDLSKQIMVRELDLSLEAASLSQIGDNTKNDNETEIPEVFWEYTAPNVLVTKWLDGVSIYDTKELERRGIDKSEVSKKLAIMFFNQAYRDGYFHADLHPGNIFVTKTGNIGLIDFGVVGTIPEKDRIAVTEILYNFLKKDYMRIAQIHMDVGYIPKDSDLELFALNCRIIGEAIVGEELKNISVGKILGRLFKITKDFGMEVQPQLLLLQKTTIVVEGVGRMLNPELNMWKLAEPWVKKWAIKNISPEAKILRFLRGELDRFLSKML